MDTDDVLYFLTHPHEDDRWTSVTAMPHVFSCDFADDDCQILQDTLQDTVQNTLQYTVQNTLHNTLHNTTLQYITRPTVHLLPHMYTDPPFHAKEYEFRITDFKKFIRNSVHPSYAEEWRAARRRAQMRCTQKKRRKFVKSTKRLM